MMEKRGHKNRQLMGTTQECNGAVADDHIGFAGRAILGDADGELQRRHPASLGATSRPPAL